MKNIGKKLFVTSAIFVLVSSAVPTSASTNTEEFDYLKNALSEIDSVPFGETDEYMEQNEKWIDEVGTRLDDYLAGFPAEKQDQIVKKLLNNDFSASETGVNTLKQTNVSNFSMSTMSATATASHNVSKYFNKTWYSSNRGGWKTYSMEPKWSVRLYGPTMKAGWTELGKKYSVIKKDKGSMYKQYKCHFDYDVFGALAGSWDIEVGRPIVSEATMIRTRCNPE
jgi:hypothetical protein